MLAVLEPADPARERSIAGGMGGEVASLSLNSLIICNAGTRKLDAFELLRDLAKCGGDVC